MIAHSELIRRFPERFTEELDKIKANLNSIPPIDPNGLLTGNWRYSVTNMIVLINEIEDKVNRLAIERGFLP